MTASSAAAPSSAARAPTLAIVNARVWTGDARRPWADAVAAAGERLVAVGSSAEVRKLALPATHVIDAHGMMLLPGFGDAHIQFVLDEEQDRALDAAMRHLNAQGVTSAQHMGTWDDLAILERAYRAGRLTTRMNAVLPLATWARLRDTVAARGRGDARLHIGGLVGFADSSFDSHTATPTELDAWTAGADGAGLQVMVHATDDRTIHTQLDIYERVAREHGTRDRRFRIEQAQHIAPDDMGRFAQLGVIASMQPYRAIAAARAEGSYAFRSLLGRGATLAFGSGWPAAPPTPIEGIHVAVTRRTPDGAPPDGWDAEQKITVEEALRAYTQGAAYAEFQEQEKGVLQRGKLADLVLVDRDLTRIAPETIRDARVMLTVVGGKVVYERQ